MWQGARLKAGATKCFDARYFVLGFLIFAILNM
jgi:hypothetical protein